MNHENITKLEELLNINNLQYLIFDMDGTLLDENKEINPEIVRKLNEYYNRGVKIILASGRHFKETTSFFDTLGIGNIDAIICCDGVYTFDTNGEELGIGAFLERADVCRLMTELDLRSCTAITDEIDYEIFLNKWDKLTHTVKNIITRNNNKAVSKSRFQVLTCEPIEKVMCIVSDDERSAIDRLRNDYTIHYYDSGGCEIFKGGVNKYSAIIGYLNKARVSPDQVVYFGDEINDIECFEHLNNCVAMTSAPWIIRDLANAVVNNITDIL